MIPLNLLYSFFIVVKHGNISKAANELNMSQPALSKSIHHLEEILSIPLFIRQPRGVILTREGQVLFEHIKLNMQQFESLPLFIEKIRSTSGNTIKIAIGPTLCKLYLIPILEVFSKKHPDITIEILNANTDEILNLVNSGVADFGIASINEVPSERFMTTILLEIQDVFMMSKKFANYQHTTQLFSPEKSKDLILPSPSNSARLHFDAYFKAHNMHIAPKLELETVDLLIDACRAGLGITIIPKALLPANQKNDFVELPTLHAIPKREISLIQLNSNRQTPTSHHIFTSFLFNH